MIKNLFNQHGWLLFIMRISILNILLTTIFFSVGYASDVKGQEVLDRKVTLELGDKATIKDVLSQIESKANVKFTYRPRLVKANKKVTLPIADGTVSQVLDELFNLDISYKVIGDQIVLIPFEEVKDEFATTADLYSIPAITVSGKITDENEAALPGVNILEKGTSNGTTSDAEGKYTIIVKDESAVLVFSFIGYATHEMVVGNQSAIDIKMALDVRALEEVVVTAFGIKREEKALGYAAQKVSGENLQKVSGVNVATSLTGKVAGLLVKNSSDFAVDPVLTIRGENPLLVIDGIAYENKTLSDISSNDIESISVLKGATASALYGYRGANGAILITTKNGSLSDNGVTVDFTTNTMFTAGFLAIPEKQSVYGRGSNNTYNINSDQSWGTTMSGETRTQWDPFLKVFRDYEYLPVGKNNFSNFLEQGYVSNNNLNLTYKEDKVALRSSVNWTQNKGQYPNSTLDKYTFTLGGDINLDKFDLTSNVSYARKESPNMGSNGYTSYDPMYSLLIWSSADFDIRDYKDNYWITKDIQQNYIFGLQPNGSYTGASQNNPYFDRYEKTNEISRDIFNADISSSYQLTSWMKASLHAGLDFYKELGELRTSMGSYLYTGNTPVPGNPYTWNGFKTGGYNIGQTSGSSINTDFLLTGDRAFNKFNVEYLAGGTIFFKQNDNMNANTVNGISVPGFFSLKASVNPAFVTQSTAAQQVNSLYGRLTLSWNRMVFVEATGRNDWSSTMPEDNSSYFYPSVATSFIVSELLPGTTSWLDLLKVRGSWTQSKRPAGIYAINSSYSIYSGTWGTLNGAGAPSSLYGTGLRPESANTTEIGLQGMVFQNRLMVDVSYYEKRMYDFLTYAPVSAATGYTSNYINTDEEITRKGWEVIVNGTPIRSKDWQLDLGVNWSTYKRFYTQYDDTYSDKKKPWLYDNASGSWKEGARYDVLGSRSFVRVPETGELIYNNGRLVYSQYDSKFGYTDPDWIWGVNSTLKYKNFSLYASFDGVVGGLMNTRTESYMWQSGSHPNSVTPERALDVAGAATAATTDDLNYLGQGVKVVSGAVTYDNQGNITSDTRVYAPNDIYTTYKQAAIDLHNSSAWGGNGSEPDTYAKTFFKLREVSLTYNVPGKFLNKWAKAASVSFVGQNVLLKAKDFKYSDPDGGVEDFSDPSVRYLGFNINVTF